MPFVDIVSLGGPLNVSYTISTPGTPSAKSIVPGLPTVVLLHPLYLGQYALHPQLADVQLRRFNLVTLDLRNHGASVGFVKDDYGVASAVDDVVKFMEALKLPPVHLVGVNYGSLIALELAALWPQRVQSLTLVSPPAMDEVSDDHLLCRVSSLSQPEDVAEGRMEIYECWKTGFPEGQPPDEVALLDAVCGALQIGTNNQQSSLVSALTKLTLATAPNNWSPPRLDEYYRSTVAFFIDRRRPTLRGITAPVLLVYCGEDIAYARESAEELQHALEVAGVTDVRLEDVPDAAQWGNLTHPEEINKLIYDMVINYAAEQDIPAAPRTVVTPFATALAQAGMHDDGDDSDDE